MVGQQPINFRPYPFVGYLLIFDVPVGVVSFNNQDKQEAEHLYEPVRASVYLI